MGKCINCGIDLQDGILCPECLNKTDDAIAKAEVNWFLSSGTFCMFSNRVEFQAKNPKKNRTIYYTDIQKIEITMKNLIGFTYGDEKYDSIAFENATIAQKWHEALSGLITLHKDVIPDEESEKEPELTVVPEPIEESKSEEINKEPVEESSVEETTPAEEKDAIEEKSEESEESEESKEEVSFFGGLSIKKIVVAAAIAIVMIVVSINIFGGNNSGGNSYYAELAAQNKMGSGFTVDEIDFKVVASKKDTKYIVKCTAKSKEAKNMYETLYGETTVYFAYAEGYGNQYQYAIADSKNEAKDKIDW